jgi:outer membrane protein assembly factor BamB
MSHATLLLLFAFSAAAADDWPRFRGPNGTGVADARNLPAEIGPGKNLAWKTALPPGFSSPVLGGRLVFLTGYEGEQLFTFAIDRSNGEIRWKNPAPKPLPSAPKGPNSPVSPSPASDGSSIYVFFDNFGVVSYDAAGKERWRQPMGPFNFPYGAGSSPVVTGKTLLLQVDQDTDSYLLALDKDTGKVRWKAPRPHATHGFSSPVIYSPAKGPREVIVSGAYEIDSYALDTGKKLWWATGMGWQAKSVPVVHDGTVYVHSWMASLAELGHKEIKQSWEQALTAYDSNKDGKIAKDEYPDESLVKIWFLYDLDKDGFLGETDWKYLLARSNAKNGLYAIKLGGRGDVTTSHVLWRYEKGLPNIPSPLFYNGVLYVLREGGILTSLDPKTGVVIKQGRIEGAVDSYFASPVAADGKIFTVSREGKAAVIKPGPQWEVASVNQFDEQVWSTPAIAGNQIFIRTQKALYCFSATPSGPPAGGRE